MNLYFHNITDFLLMGGYGAYIWTTYAISSIILVLQIRRAKTHFKTLLKKLRS